MSNKFFYFAILFLSLIILTYTSSEDPVLDPKIWTPESLYNHVSNTFLHPKNPRLHQNIRHMIVDPEEYLKYADLKEAKQYMEYLYQQYKISSHIFFISHMKSKFKLDEEIAEFVSKLSYSIYKNYEEYDEKMTLTAVFFIKDRKMRIKTSSALRENLTDYDCLNILNRRKNDLRNNNYQEVVNGLMKDILDTYKYNIENQSLGLGANDIIIYTILIIIVISVLFFILNQEKPSKQEDKVKAFLDKLKHKENKKEIFTESCIICLEDFPPNETIKGFENSGDKENLKKEETSILECGHKFHRKCIEDWLKKQANCPICRMQFNIKGNDTNNKQSSGGNINFNFNSILSEILRIQSDINMLNQREINRIRNVYYPSRGSRGSTTSHNKSYSSFNKSSGGATSGW